MTVQKASCVYRGNTFYCEFMVIGGGPEAEVLVRYNGQELSARKGALTARDVAENLLSELVVLEAIAEKVAWSTGQRQAIPSAGAEAHERRAA